MSTKKPLPPTRELTADEIKKINRQVLITVIVHVIKRLLLIPIIFTAFIVLTVLGVSTKQLTHAISGEHNIREQN